MRTSRSIVLPLFQEDFDGLPEEYATKKAREIWQKFPAPWIVKSHTEDSTTRPTERSQPFGRAGIHLAKTFNELVRAIEDGVNHKKSILVEEFIFGKVGSLHVIPGFRGDENYILLPENFLPSEKEELQSLAKKLHSHLDAKHYLKIDFVFHTKLGFFLLSIDSLPDMREDSHFWQSASKLGVEMHHIIEHIVEKARK